MFYPHITDGRTEAEATLWTSLAAKNGQSWNLNPPDIEPKQFALLVQMSMEDLLGFRIQGSCPPASQKGKHREEKQQNTM